MNEGMNEDLQVNSDWTNKVKTNKDINYIESYEMDDNFRRYVNDMNRKREENSVSGVTYSVVDVLEHLNSRMMYIESKMNMSYENDHDNYFNYDKVLMKMNSQLNM